MIGANALFKLISTQDRARRGEFTTPHGAVQTPVFMNVGTQAAIKGALSADDLEKIGCQVQLSNTYHLHVRPGDGIIRSLGGLHKFMSWNGPVLTDSGGFQVFSLARLRKIDESGVRFSSHVDGRRIFMGPDESMRIQSNLGSDIVMAFDECVKIPSPYEYVRESCDRTYRWLVRCKTALGEYNSESGAVNPGQLLFGINQGAIFPGLRTAHMEKIAELDLAGYAIGGLAVGESVSEMYDTVDIVTERMPRDKPRYLMGVGTPGNIIEAVHRGIDLFDCVMPARNGRHGHLFTWGGILNVKNERYGRDERAIDPLCGCPVCGRYSRAYLRHLFKAQELLAMRFSVLHNLYFYNSLLSKVRGAIENGGFGAFRAEYSPKLDGKITADI
jgi:queuine tRNA-ribosyltransferase